MSHLPVVEKSRQEPIYLYTRVLLKWKRYLPTRAGDGKVHAPLRLLLWFIPNIPLLIAHLHIIIAVYPFLALWHPTPQIVIGFGIHSAYRHDSTCKMENMHSWTNPVVWPDSP